MEAFNRQENKEKGFEREGFFGFHIRIKADDEYLTELLFLGSRKESIDSKQYTQKKAPVIEDTIRWLDIYFSGRHSGFYPEV